MTGAAPAPSDSLTILLADDVACIRWVTQRFLESQGHTVHVADDGREAVAAAEEHDFDVVLLDLLMPNMDGMEAATRIRELAAKREHPVTIIAATSHQLDSLGENWNSGRFDAVLSKPFQADDLTRTIRELRLQS